MLETALVLCPLTELTSWEKTASVSISKVPPLLIAHFHMPQGTLWTKQLKIEWAVFIQSDILFISQVNRTQSEFTVEEILPEFLNRKSFFFLFQTGRRTESELESSQAKQCVL